MSEATNVVFVGYSLPVTDIVATYLFRESLAPHKAMHKRHNQPAKITVVNFVSEDDPERNAKERDLRGAYRKVFPDIRDDQFFFRGALEWASSFCTRGR